MNHESHVSLQPPVELDGEKIMSPVSISRLSFLIASAGSSWIALAQEVATETVSTTSPSALPWAYLSAGILMGLAVLGGASGQGRAAAAAYEGIGRNPQSAEKIGTPLLIGLALIEFQTILAFIIAILLVLK